MTAGSEGDHIPNTHHTCLALLLVAVITLSTVGAVGVASGAKEAAHSAVPNVGTSASQVMPAAQRGTAQPTIMGTGAAAVFRYPTQLWMQAVFQDAYPTGKPPTFVVVLSGALQAGTARLGGQPIDIYFRVDGGPWTRLTTTRTVASGSYRGLYSFSVRYNTRVSGQTYAYYASYKGATNAGASQSNGVAVRFWNRIPTGPSHTTLVCLASSQAIKRGGYVTISGWSESGYRKLAGQHLDLFVDGPRGYSHLWSERTGSDGYWRGLTISFRSLPSGPYRFYAVSDDIRVGNVVHYRGAHSNFVEVAHL